MTSEDLDDDVEDAGSQGKRMSLGGPEVTLS